MSEYIEFPQSCLYGALGALAPKLSVPLGFAYPALLTLAGARGIPMVSTVRTHLYTCLLAERGGGKGQTQDRAKKAIPIAAAQLIETTPNSDRGIVTAIYGSDPKHRIERPSKHVIFTLDEMGKLMEKISIQCATLAQDLCSLFDGKPIGGADKKTEASVLDKQVSILGNLPADTPEKFAHYFGSNTVDGLFDRFIFATPEHAFRYAPPEIQEADGLNFSRACRVPREYFDQMHDWRERSPETRSTRLGEIMLRVAVISASVNSDDSIGPQSFWAATQFAEWQEKIRTKYQPGKARNLSAELTSTVLGKLGHLPLENKKVQVEDGRVWIYPSRFATFYRLYEEYGAPMFRQTINALCLDKAISYKIKDQRLTHIGPASNGVFGDVVEKKEEAS